MLVNSKSVLKTVLHSTHRLLFAVILSALALQVPIPQQAAAAGEAVRTYYLNCSTGSDSRSGLSPSLAWKSLAKANSAALAPGDKLLLLRGCTFTGTLKAKWNGTAAARILIGAYGSGALPKIQNSSSDVADGYHNNVDISGSYLTIEYLETTIVNPPVSSGCQNNPLGFFVGFSFRNPSNVANGGSYNILRYSKATKHMAGVHFQNNTHHDQVLNNTFSNNIAMSVLTPISVSGSDDIGAYGILLKGHHHEIAYNYLSNNLSVCTFDTIPQGNAIELYQAQQNAIHHNTSVNDRVFSELGGSSGYRADGNTYYYNLVISSVPNARFIVARGSQNNFGPTYRTTLLNNTVYFTGSGSQAIVCHAGCSTDIMTARNNIAWAVEKAAYADARFVESNNLYWSSNGSPLVQFQGFAMSASSKVANPKFVNAASSNFSLQSGSPAVNAGLQVGLNLDLNGQSVPAGLLPDMGAHESLFTGAPDEIVPPDDTVPPAVLLPVVHLPFIASGN